MNDRVTARIVRLYGSGRSTRDVADKLGVSEATIRRRLKAAGVKARPRTRRSRLEKVDPARLFGIVAEHGIIRTAKRFGLTRRMLQIYLAKLRSADKGD